MANSRDLNVSGRDLVLCSSWYILYRQVDQFVADCRSVQQGYMMYKRKREAAVSTYLCGGGWVGGKTGSNSGLVGRSWGGGAWTRYVWNCYPYCDRSASGGVWQLMGHMRNARKHVGILVTKLF